MTKAKKLPHPKVWLVFDDEGRLTDWASHRLGIAKSGEQAHAYTPAKPTKVCVWKYIDITHGEWKSGCNKWTIRGSANFKVCPYCTDKIRRTR